MIKIYCVLVWQCAKPTQALHQFNFDFTVVNFISSWFLFMPASVWGLLCAVDTFFARFSRIPTSGEKNIIGCLLELFYVRLTEQMHYLEAVVMRAALTERITHTPGKELLTMSSTRYDCLLLIGVV
jgi:hypothetical protein